MQRVKGAHCEVVQPSIAMHRTVPLGNNGSEIHRAFSLERFHIHNEITIARLPQARILGPSGVIITQDGGVVEESTWGNGWLERDRLFTSWRLPKVQSLEGHYYTIASLFDDGYAHWLLDALPRLFALEHLPVDEMNIIVSRPLNSWQQESLDALGFSNLNLIPLNDSHLQLEALYFPSFVGDPGNPHPWGCQWLRQQLIKNNECGREKRRIYVSRRSAKRRILNEDELEPILQLHGFEIVEPERMNFDDEIRLFSQAEFVIGPHGAGISNILFAPSDCRVLEIFDPRHVKVNNYALANVLHQPYWYLLGKVPDAPTSRHQTSGHDNYCVSVRDFVGVVEALLNSKSSHRA